MVVKLDYFIVRILVLENASEKIVTCFLFQTRLWVSECRQEKYYCQFNHLSTEMSKGLLHPTT